MRRKPVSSGESFNNTPKEAYSSDTLRTIEIIERFPQPPGLSDRGLCRGGRAPLPLFAPEPLRSHPVQFIRNDEAERSHSTAERNGQDAGDADDGRVNDSAVCLNNPENGQHVSEVNEVQRDEVESVPCGSLAPPIQAEADPNCPEHAISVDQPNTSSVVDNGGEDVHGPVAASPTDAQSVPAVFVAPLNQTLGVRVAAPDVEPLPSQVPCASQDGARSVAERRQSFEMVSTTVTSTGRLCPHLQAVVLSRNGRSSAGVRTTWKEAVARTAQARINKGKTQCWKCSARQRTCGRSPPSAEGSVAVKKRGKGKTVRKMKEILKWWAKCSCLHLRGQ